MYNIDKIRHRKPSGIAAVFLKMLSFFLHQGFLPTLKNKLDNLVLSLLERPPVSQAALSAML